MRKKWLGLIGLLVLAAPQIRAQMTAVSAAVQDANGQHYVNCSWSVVFVGQNTIPGAGPYQPQALLVGQQGECDSSGNLRVTLADNVNTITPTPSQWNFSICSAPGYVPGGTFCRSNMLVTVTGQAQDLTAFFQPLMPLLPPGGGGGGGTQYITDATPLMGLMRTGTTLGLQTTCVTGQYLGWNGSSWACTGAGVGGGTTVTVNGTAAIPNILNFNNTSPLPPAGSQNVTFQLNGNSVSAYVPAGGGGGAGILVNGTTPSGTVNFNASTPLPPPNGINVNWTLAGTNLTGAIVGDGNPNSCLIGTGIFATCPGGGGGGGATLPVTAQYDLFASTGAGAAQASGVGATAGFLRAQVLESTGNTAPSAPSGFTPPNGSVEYFPLGATYGGISVGTLNGIALHFSHSGKTTGSAGNGGVGLAGGNATGVASSYQIFLDCEQVGCDFKVPVTYLGTGIGGGGGGSGTVGSGTGGFFTWFPTSGTAVTSNAHLDDGVTTQTTITSQETFAAPGISVTGNGGIAMTGAGGSLPAPVAGQGGIGIGPGNVPYYYSNGGSWTAIGSGGGGGVSSINGGTGAFTFTGSGFSGCTSGTCTFTAGGSTTVPNPILTTAGATLPAPTAGQGSIGIGPNGVPSVSVNGGAWLPIATTPAPTTVAIQHGAQPVVCQAQSTGAALTFSGLTINAGDTVFVTVSAYNLAMSNFTVADNLTPGNYTLETSILIQGSGVGIFASAVSQTLSPTQITVTRTSGSSKFAACVVTYTGVTAILNTLTPASGAVGSATQSISATAAAAGHYMVSALAVQTNTLIDFTSPAQAGNLLGHAGTTLTGSSANATAACENGPAAAAGSTLTCTTTANSSGTGATPSWAAVAVELVGGAVSDVTVATTIYNCTIPSNVSFGTAQGSMCSQALGATAKQWIIHCNLPFNFTSGTGTANIGISLTAAPTFQTYITTMLGAAAGPTYGAVALSATGNTLMVTRAVTDATLYTLTLDGTIAAAANTTFSIYGTTTAGTAAFRPGVACVLQ